MGVALHCLVVCIHLWLFPNELEVQNRFQNIFTMMFLRGHFCLVPWKRILRFTGINGKLNIPFWFICHFSLAKNNCFFYKHRATTAGKWHYSILLNLKIQSRKLFWSSPGKFIFKWPYKILYFTCRFKQNCYVILF